ncbi:FxLYD domain-containing protein [Truepera radiovictrix]|uniref:FxLYD domain-containing protein n=1 Tax=Truepera radiovictrix TaxID=332249 RepID=UPI003CCB7299
MRLKVIQATLQDDSYAQRLIGRVVNDDAVTRRFAQAVYVCYDDSGRLADAGSTYTDPTDLGAGQTGTFSTTIIGPRTEVASCDVIAQATNL